MGMELGSDQRVVRHYDEEAEDDDPGQVRPGEVAWGCGVRHGSDQAREKWARTRNSPKMPAWIMSSQVSVTERRRGVVEVFMGCRDRLWFVLDDTNLHRSWSSGKRHRASGDGR